MKGTVPSVLIPPVPLLTFCTHNFCHHCAKWEQQGRRAMGPGAEMETSHAGDGGRNPLLPDALSCGRCLSLKAVFKLGLGVSQTPFVLMCRELKLGSLKGPTSRRSV